MAFIHRKVSIKILVTLLLVTVTCSLALSMEKKKFELWKKINDEALHPSKGVGEMTYNDIVEALENDDQEAQNYDPEEAGLLMHEYFDEVYNKFPEYKRKKGKMDIMNQGDPLKEKHDPYEKDSHS